MQVTSTQLNTKAKRVDAVKLSRYLINSKGFTLIELLTSIAIIGILAAVGIQQYTQFKVRGYDAHSKQGLRDMSFTCKAYWTENDISDECDLAKAKEYGFVQNTDVVATLPPSTLDSFCASAKHNSSPNTYYMDSVGTINSEENCSKAVSVATLVPKSGSCPSGWTVPVEELSGGRSRPLNYCVAESGALPIVPKTGACPSGWIVPVEELSGGRSRPLNYCMAEDTDTPSIVPRSGSCPSGWTVPVEELSGGRSRPLNYCVAESGALPVVPKTGACPSGWIVPVEELSGGRSRPLNYCMAENTDTPSIVPKSGSCPSGWKALAEELSGGRSRPLNYCVEDDG